MALGSRLGAVLFPLPPNLGKDLNRLQSFLSLMPGDGRIAFEFRHSSWFDDEIFACLRARNCALCMADTDESERSNLISTAMWGYVRLRRSQYSCVDLSQWKEQILSQPWNHAYVFFEHEEDGIGPKLAAEFLELLDVAHA